MALFAARHLALKGKLNHQKFQTLDGGSEGESEGEGDSKSERENGVTIDTNIKNSPITAKNKQYSTISDENSGFLSVSDMNTSTDSKSDLTIPIEVVAIPCVGNSANLLQQMTALDSVSGGHGIYPVILNSVKGRTIDYDCHNNGTIEIGKENIASGNQDFTNRSDRIFGEPYTEHYNIWLRLKKEIDVEFDLIYSPRAFELLLDSFENNARLWENCNILYYHCGGVEGNDSQLGRYRYKGLL